MFNEHCVLDGCNVEFTTSNYNITTTPRREYEIVADKLVCPEDQLKDSKGQTVRIVRSMEDLMKLDAVQQAGLRPIEIISVVSPLGS